MLNMFLLNLAQSILDLILRPERSRSGCTDSPMGIRRTSSSRGSTGGQQVPPDHRTASGLLVAGPLTFLERSDPFGDISSVPVRSTVFEDKTLFVVWCLVPCEGQLHGNNPTPCSVFVQVSTIELLKVQS